jgi:hypothetical protein
MEDPITMSVSLSISAKEPYIKYFVIVLLQTWASIFRKFHTG